MLPAMRGAEGKTNVSREIILPEVLRTRADFKLLAEAVGCEDAVRIEETRSGVLVRVPSYDLHAMRELVVTRRPVGFKIDVEPLGEP